MNAKDIILARKLGSGSGGGGITPSGTLPITENGTHDVTQYAEAEVNVPIPEGYIVPTGSKTITSNGTHDVKAVESAVVDVPIPEGYVIPSGSVNINTNGTHDVGGKKSAIVNVPTGAARTSADLTASGATVNVPAGLYSEAASKSVASGTQGTPTASKSAVSGNSITVTPSCTDTTGYISGTTKTGTGVTVSASELVSGNKAISANGTGIDVTNYKTVSVDVPAPPPTLQSKSATPSLSPQTLSADGGYDGLSSVSISAITKELLASLDADFVAENIKKDVDLFGLIGVLEGGGGIEGLEGQTIISGTFTPANDITSGETFSDSRLKPNTAYTVLAFPLGVYPHLYENLGEKFAFVGSVSKRYNTNNNNTNEAALCFDAYGSGAGVNNCGFKKGYANNYISVNMSSKCKMYAGHTYNWIAIEDK